MSYKTVVEESSVVDAVSNAFSDLTSLGEECREIVDNASEGLAQTSRIQTLDETADQLENLSEPDVPESIGDMSIKYAQLVNKDKRRGASRSVRRDNAVLALHAVMEHCEKMVEEKDGVRVHGEIDSEAAAEIEQLREECEQAADEAEGCEFPGMYG